MNGRPWTPAQLAELRARYPDEPTAPLAKALGHSLSSTYARAHALGLHKSAEFMSRVESGRLASGRWAPGSTPGLKTRFLPGHASWNKGKCYNPGGRSVETRFRPGQASRRWDPAVYCVGALRITTDGCLLIRVGPGPKEWMMMTRYAWWSATGHLPRRDQVVRAKNGDPHDCRIENLELVTRRENMLKNSVHTLPKPLAQLVQLRGALVRKIRNQERKAA